mgnify:CR=1 FL=1
MQELVYPTLPGIEESLAAQHVVVGGLNATHSVAQAVIADHRRGGGIRIAALERPLLLNRCRDDHTIAVDDQAAPDALLGEHPAGVIVAGKEGVPLSQAPIAQRQRHQGKCKQQAKRQTLQRPGHDGSIGTASAGRHLSG